MAKPKVFISYSTKDMTWARQFADALAEQEVDVWFDIYRIPPGQPFMKNLEKAFRQSDYIVVLLTPETVESPNLYFEIGAAFGLGKPLVPVVPKEMDLAQLPLPLRDKQVLIRTTPKETAKLLASQIQPPTTAT